MVSIENIIATGLGVLLIICLNGCTVESQRRGRLGAGVNIAKEFDCPEEFGYYQHPTDCTMYYVCVFGGALLESCTGGLMYSQELQTCDWPRNVGCGVSEVEAATISNIPRVTESRNPSRHSTTGATRHSGISARENSQRQQQDEIAKHQLYADDVGPAEEAENDRQQRVYRGQPATVNLGQNIDSRHQITNSIPSPSGRLASGDKISVISFGTQQQQQQQQQQHAQYRVEPTSAPSTYTQELLVPTKASSIYNGSQSFQSDLSQYDDPYYSLYDDDVELYRDVDYGQYQGNNGQQQNNKNQHHRGQNTYKQQEQISPVLTPVSQPDRSQNAYIQPTYNNQDVYTQQAIGAQDYNENNYNNPQIEDQIQYQPVVRGQTKSPASRQQTRQSLETSEATSKPSIHSSTPSERDISRPKHITHQILLKTIVSLRDPFKASDSPLSINNQNTPKRTTVAVIKQNEFQPKQGQRTSEIIALSNNFGNSTKSPTRQFADKSIPIAHSYPNSRDKSHKSIDNESLSKLVIDSVYLDLSTPTENTPSSTTNQLENAIKYTIHRKPTTEASIPISNRQKTFNPRELIFKSTVENIHDYNSELILPVRNLNRTNLDRFNLNSQTHKLIENKITVTSPYSLKSVSSEEENSFIRDPSSIPDVSLVQVEATTRRSRGRIIQNTTTRSEGKSKAYNEIAPIRVRTTTSSPDYQVTPGPVRGSVRNRGSASYTTASGETGNRGTPASITRSRPTLKPSTAIVSKSQEFIDIYRYGEASRPEPVYATPQVDKTAAKCRKDVCLLPDCSCGGKEIPGDLAPETVPQIVLLTFDDSVNDLNKGLYSSLFEKGRVNPNGCPIAATFYVSHEWTNYGQVQSLYADGHEIASHSVSHSFGEQFSQKKWTREIAGQREILAAYGGVKLEDVRGMRAPFLSVGGNKMFKMLYDSNFTYDSSMPVYENKPPSYPYTFDYKIFHDCMIPPCPTRSYPGVWEVPMVMWQDLNGGRCSMGDACSNPPTSDGVYKMLIKNFERHYTTNRAPFGLFYHAAWFTQAHHKEGFEAFLDTIVNMPDVWLVTNWQALQWVRDPTPISRINSFLPFQCNYPERPKKCNNPKVCNLWHKSGVRYMKTCQPCPDVYPWTGKSGVRNSRVDNEIIDE